MIFLISYLCFLYLHYGVPFLSECLEYTNNWCFIILGVNQVALLRNHYFGRTDFLRIHIVSTVFVVGTGHNELDHRLCILV